MIQRFAMSIVAAALAVGSLSAANYFPLQFGNTWTYRNHQSGRTFTVRVGTPALVNDKVYYSLQGYVSTNVLARIDEKNTLVYIDNDTNEERPLISFTPFEGGWLHAPQRPCEQESQTQERRGAYSGPAGEFDETLVVRFRSFSCADVGTEAEQFTENVGMVHRVEQSFTGPVEYHLVHARIGNMILNGLPTGLFSVTLDEVQGSNTMTALLRVRANNAPIKLAFPTAQEFELVLRDEAGNPLWTWSEGQFFEQAAHERNLFSDWTIAVPVPHPSATSTPEPKNYTVHAWLTTDGVAPQYAATLPVRISPSVAE